ncbi:MULTISPECIES: limonene-1,2-epoxide hydrolase family protein [Caulobacter]|jgi:limonene-1,2-epoxide hydrolase|uniref:Limonene-1,2-epoxide hydrolase n=1 Tax=Caulobacter vibrioides OR37 TaxID=1292034 RepID=R0D4J8_CAUVI|nr:MULTISPECIES: limonene-1,2-epoxide hydrolase family protein [Caulobacter]ENZ83521.1 limonene-1,2-epoxide hydrolase [Caulobacter vibrioides OR37]MBQ1561449.1 nuclear transport factor 2 family protein [Caulobacter sp.]
MKIAGALLALALLAGSAQAQDTDASRLATAREMIHAWKVADWRKVADLFAEDGSLKSMMLPPVNGREAIYARIAALGKGAPDGVTLDVAHIGVIDGLVFMERTDRFTYNGHPGAVPVVGVLDIRGGKVKEWREYYDRASLEKALKGEP